MTNAPWLITTDLHLAAQPSAAYRFGIFKWLRQQQEKYRSSATFILGDLTQNKDKHPSSLVNRAVDEITVLKPPVYVLCGNHDGIDPNNPFFRFLNQIEGIHFIIAPTYFYLGEQAVAMIPHFRDQARFDEACHTMIPKRAHVMLHQTFEGAQAETGAHLSGLGASAVEAAKPLGVWAGDVHKPQQCGPVTYVGAPYPIRFGDDFKPRVLLLNGTDQKDLQYPCLRKWRLTVRDADEIEKNDKLKPGDHAKITLELAREEAVKWPTLKAAVLAACKSRGLEVFGCSVTIKTNSIKEKTTKEHHTKPADVFKSYCKAEGLGTDLRQAGEALLEGM